MKNIKNIKIKAGVFVVAALFLATAVTVNADPKEYPSDHDLDPTPPPTPPSKYPLRPVDTIKARELPYYQVLWHNTWIEGNQMAGEAGRVAVDSQDNVITCGTDNNGDPVLLKYSPSGDLLWNAIPTPVACLSEPVDLATLDPEFQPRKSSPQPMTPEQRERFFDIIHPVTLTGVVCDSQDNIISCGWRLLEESIILVVVKHDPDGNQIWNTTYSYLPGENGAAAGMGMTVDSIDNVYVVGMGMIDDGASISATGLIIKIGNYFGITHWVKLHVSPPFTIKMYMDAEANTGNNLYIVGSDLCVDPENESITMIVKILNKYTGQTVDSIYIENDLICYGLTIDWVESRIYAVGLTFMHSIDAIIVKLDFSLNIIYQHTTPDDEFYDVEIRKNDELVLATAKVGDQYAIALHSRENGTRIARYCIGEISEPSGWWVAHTAGVAVDSNEDILASGGIGAIDTIKVHTFDELTKCTPLGKPEGDLGE